MLDTHVTMVGNLVAEPRITTTANGHHVATFRIASTPRRLDRGTGEWHDGETLFATVTCWRGLAENVVASMKKGQSVVVWGRLSQREYETKAGEKRQPAEIDAIAIGADLSRAVVIVKRAERSLSGVPSQPSVVGDEGSAMVTDSVDAIDWEYASSPPEGTLPEGAPPEGGLAEFGESPFGQPDDPTDGDEPVALAAQDPKPELVGAGAGLAPSGGLMGALGRGRGRANGG
jgi:single-strand DNA-binding protein